MRLDGPAFIRPGWVRGAYLHPGARLGQADRGRQPGHARPDHQDVRLAAGHV